VLAQRSDQLPEQLSGRVREQISGRPARQRNGQALGRRNAARQTLRQHVNSFAPERLVLLVGRELLRASVPAQHSVPGLVELKVDWLADSLLAPVEAKDNVLVAVKADVLRRVAAGRAPKVAADGSINAPPAIADPLETAIASREISARITGTITAISSTTGRRITTMAAGVARVGTVTGATITGGALLLGPV